MYGREIFSLLFLFLGISKWNTFSLKYWRKSRKITKKIWKNSQMFLWFDLVLGFSPLIFLSLFYALYVQCWMYKVLPWKIYSLGDEFLYLMGKMSSLINSPILLNSHYISMFSIFFSKICSLIRHIIWEILMKIQHFRQEFSSIVCENKNAVKSRSVP